MTQGPWVATVLGASGAVGKEIVRHLCARPGWSRIVLVNRRELALDDIIVQCSSKLEQHVVKDMDASILEAKSSSLFQDTAVDAAFVAMGAGRPSTVTEDVLHQVDVTLPTAFARGLSSRCKHFSLLTAVGADVHANPGWFMKTRAGGGLYNQLKGQVEANIQAASQESFAAFRPATLIGTPNTPKIISLMSPLVNSLLPVKYQESHISTLAAAMVYHAERELESGMVGKKSHIFEGEELHDLYAAIPFSHGKHVFEKGQS